MVTERAKALRLCRACLYPWQAEPGLYELQPCYAGWAFNTGNTWWLILKDPYFYDRGHVTMIEPLESLYPWHWRQLEADAPAVVERIDSWLNRGIYRKHRALPRGLRECNHLVYLTDYQAWLGLPPPAFSRYSHRLRVAVWRRGQPGWTFFPYADPCTRLRALAGKKEVEVEVPLALCEGFFKEVHCGQDV